MSGVSPAPNADLTAWLAYLERLHPRGVELGLDRVSAVRERLALNLPFPVVTVGGTNGKGSTCALLERMLGCAGYRVGLYTSPHLLRYNERVRIAGAQAADTALTAAFERIEAARGEISLTYFEFGTLAAALLFRDAALDVAVLEVGLGGRLDAVNAFDSDCAVITSIGLDHMDYLGPTREDIGREKAGIFRGGRPAVVAEPDPPGSLIGHARAIGAQLYLVDRDFGATGGAGQWSYWSWLGRRSGLPRPALRGACQLGNAAAALAALDCLRERLPVDMGAVRRGLVEVELPGRFQVLPGRPTIVLDVAHNPHAAQRLGENLDALRRDAGGRTLAVFGMLKDKDIAGVAAALGGRVDSWWIAGLPGERGADGERVRAALAAAGLTAPAEICADAATAFRRAREAARPDDRIVVFGSFLTVSAVLALADGPHR
ncbi:MAG TPA: bifunctional tetrahydrofolate synthase/dihydrofolate synthase [Burkholderiales bacterium]